MFLFTIQVDENHVQIVSLAMGDEDIEEYRYPRAGQFIYTWREHFDNCIACQFTLLYHQWVVQKRT